MTRIAHLDGLEDWEVGVLMEMRALDAAGLLEPVLDAILAGLEAMELRAVEEKVLEASRRAGRKEEPQGAGTLAAGLLRIRTGLAESERAKARDRVRSDVAARSASGRRLAGASHYQRNEVIRAMAAEIAEKIHIGRINRGRAFAGTSTG